MDAIIEYPSYTKIGIQVITELDQVHALILSYTDLIIVGLTQLVWGMGTIGRATHAQTPPISPELRNSYID
jgi:hypothetical protein